MDNEPKRKRVRNATPDERPPAPVMRTASAVNAVVKSEKRAKKEESTAAAIEKYRNHMLTHTNTTRVLNKIMDAALDDDHRHQAAAWKIVTDRIVPTSAIEQEVAKSNVKTAIQINITGVGGVNSVIEGEN